MRSILFTKQMRGTRYLSAWRQTVSDCGSTPATESNTAIAPSSTRSARSTSAVKSTWPGVSMRVSRWPCHAQLTAAEKMVIPRSRSCGSKSVTVVPSWTSPVLRVVPVRWRIRSVTVVSQAANRFTQRRPPRFPGAAFDVGAGSARVLVQLRGLHRVGDLGAVVGGDARGARLRERRARGVERVADVLERRALGQRVL